MYLCPRDITEMAKIVNLVPTNLPTPTIQATAGQQIAAPTAATAGIVGIMCRTRLRLKAITEAEKAARLVPINRLIHITQAMAAQQTAAHIPVTADTAITALLM